jgi:histone H3/H4
MADFICGTPFETQLMKERWKRLVKEAIRDKGGKINSIAPEEVRRLVEAYLAQHPNRRWNVHNS